jgi:hypothetical protein
LYLSCNHSLCIVYFPVQPATIKFSMCSTGFFFLFLPQSLPGLLFFIFFSMRGTFITFFFPLFLNLHSRTLQWGYFLCYWSMLQRFWAFPRTMEASIWREWRLGVCSVLLRGNVIESYFHPCSDLLGIVYIHTMVSI